MKNLKKVLALVLAFACAFTMFAGAVVYPDVPAGSEYSEAITMLSDLGIIQGKDDGKYHSEDTITRAEACALIARMLTGDPQVSQYAGASNFTDVVKGSWKESVVGYCVVNGITVGVGNNKFEPDRAITDAEFVTMVVRAMGYETTGTSYPYGHISAAQANGLLDDVTVVPSSAALRGEDAQIIYNALFADYARGAKRVNTTHGTTVEEYPTIAEDVFELAKLAQPKKGDVDFYGSDADITCQAHTWVIAGADTRDGDNEYVAYKIDDKKNELDKSVSVTFSYDGDASALLGYQVELWGDVSHTGDDLEVVAIKTVKGQSAVEWNPSMDTDSTKAIVDGEKYQTKTAAMPERVTATKDKIEGVFTKTGEDVAAFKLVDGSDIMDIMEVKDGNIYRLVDWDSDGDVDFVIADIAKYAKVTSLTNKRIGLESMDGKKSFNLDLDMDNLVVDLDESAEKDDVVEIKVTDRSWTKSDKEIVTISITAVDSVEKELTKLSTKKAAAYYDDEPIDVADESAWNFISLDEENRGSDYTLYLNRNGLIVKSSEGEDAASGYLMILDTGKGSTATNGRKLATVDVMYGTGDNAGKYVEDVKVVKDVKIDVDGAYDEDTRSFIEPLVVGQIFKYYMNEDGEIKKLKSATNVNDDDDWSYNDKWDRLSANGTTYGVKDADVIFVMEENAIVEDSYDHYGEVDFDCDNWHIDDDMVAVLSADDLADLDDMKVGGQFLCTDPDADNNVDLDYVDDTWLENTDGVDMEDVAIAFKANTNKDVESIIFCVKNINAFRNSTKIALVTDVDYDKNDVVTIEAAMDGKVDSWTSAEDEDLEDVVVKFKQNPQADPEEFAGANDNARMTAIDNFVGKGKYAEVTFDKDGNVKEVAFLYENEDAGVAYGDEYVVARVAIGNTVKDDRFSVMAAQAVYADKDSIYFIDSKSDIVGCLTDSDTAFYTFADAKPTIAGAASADYKDKDVVVTNGFDKTLDIKAEKNLQATINDSDDHDGDYYFADVAVAHDDIDRDDLEDYSISVAAVFGFEDPLYETMGSVKLSKNLSYTYGDGQKHYTQITTPANVKKDDIVLTGEYDGLKVEVKDDGYIDVTNVSAKAGSYTYKVAVGDYKPAELVVTVEKAALNLGDGTDVVATEGENVKTITLKNLANAIKEKTGLIVEKIVPGQSTNNAPTAGTAKVEGNDVVITLNTNDYKPVVGSTLDITLATENYEGSITVTFTNSIA